MDCDVCGWMGWRFALKVRVKMKGDISWSAKECFVLFSEQGKGEGEMVRR